MVSSRSSLVWTLALFFFSGATSLVYEVLWTRRLSLTFGHTVLAVSTVLTVFMTGLALGSFLAGRWTDRERRRLATESDPRGAARFLSVYGMLEIFIGVWAVLSLFLLNGVEAIYLWAARSGAQSSTQYLLVFAGSFLVLLPPTTAMGATLPVFTQLLVASKEQVGTWLSRIYGWNTLGACLGAAMGGFLLLPNLGLKLSVVGAGMANLAIGAVGIVASRRYPAQALDSSVAVDPDEENGRGTGSRLLPICFGVSGFAAMIYQIGWTRGLVLSLGSSTYSFATILTAFLASLGLGSLIYKRGMGNRVPRVWHLAVLQFVIAFSAWLASFCIGHLPEIMVAAIPALDFSFAKILTFDFLLVLVLMALPTLAMGLTFPLVTHLYTDRMTSLGKRLGEAYASNTCGAILGSFLGGFVLVPQFGAQKALLGAVLVNLVVGLVLAFADRVAGPRLRIMAPVAACGLLLVLFTPSWDPSELSAGAGIYARAENFLFRPSFYKDGVSATVTVGFNGPHTPYLKINGKTDASISPQDMSHQVLIGFLPVALHPNPKQIAVLGLGSGITAAAMVAVDSVESVHCSELEPSVVDVQSYFGPYNQHLLENPKLDLHVTDGRTFILGAPQMFDLIVSQPSNPWMAGIGNLYTEDFYRACGERLNPDGLMCQWFNLYSVSDYDLELVLSTFYTAFPEGIVCQVGLGDIFLVGSKTPVEFSEAHLAKLWQQEDVAFWPQLIGLLKPSYIFGTYVASRQEVLSRLSHWKDGEATAPLNTDDRPLLEFQAPRSLYIQDSAVSAYPQSFPDTVPPAWVDDPRTVMGALFGRIQLGRFIDLEQRVDQAMLKDYPLAPLAGAILAQKSADVERTEGLLRALPVDLASRREAQILLGDLHREAGQWETALMNYRHALEDPLPGSSYILAMRAGECAAKAGQADDALKFYALAAENSARPDPVFRQGEVMLTMKQDPEAAYFFFQEAVKRDPYDFISLHRMALIEYREGKLEEAFRHATESYRGFPEMRTNVELLRDLALKKGLQSDALRYQKEAADLRQREVDLQVGQRAE